LTSLSLSEHKDYNIQDYNWSLLYWDETWSVVREEHMVVNISPEFILKLGRQGVDWINLAQGRDT